MAEPARKYQDIEPDIRPHLSSMEGGGETTPGRANLEAVKDSENDDSIEGIKNAEENTNQGWENNVSGSKSTQSKIFGQLGGLKKKGPLTSIILTVVGGGMGVSTLFSPALLIVHMKETMVEKFNAQLASMEVRSTKLLRLKLGNSTVSGTFCQTFLNKCRYASMSEVQYNKFKAAGIEVQFEANGATYLNGRKVVTGLKFNDEVIGPGEFTKKLADSPEFSSAVIKAKSSKFSGFADNIWERIKTKFSISKAATEIAGESEEASLRNVQKATKTGDMSDTVETHNGVDHSSRTGETDPLNDNKLITEDGKYPVIDEAEAGSNSIYEATNPTMEDIKAGAKAVAEDGGAKAGTEAAEQAAEAATKGTVEEALGAFTKGAWAAPLESTLKVTGWLDNACTVYRAVQALGYAAKVVRAVQLARFAMLFLNIADQIKAGDANPDDVSYLGKMLTNEIAANLASMKFKSATDSFGYKFAAYNERGQMSTMASQFLAGGGLPGKFIAVTDMINRVLGGTPKETCRLLGNTFVSLASGAVGIAMMFVPGAGPIVFTAKAAINAAANVVFSVGMMFIPELLKDIVAGKLVDKTTVGEAAGDAYVSGASGLLGSMAQRGGNAPLIPTQALAYNNLTKEVLAQYAEADRLAYSPFDFTNRNTFMGKIFAQLIPYATNMSSLPSVLSSLLSIPTRSLAMVTSNNVMATDSIDNYTMCPDLDYNNLTDVEDGTGDKVQIATDPYCNVMYGIPPDALETEPMDVVAALESQKNVDGTILKQIDDKGMIVVGSDYQKFFTNCISRERPLGDMGPDFQQSDGRECLFDDDPSDDTPLSTTHYNSNYYLYYIDQRALSAMDDEEMAIDPFLIPHEYVEQESFPEAGSSGDDYTFNDTTIGKFYTTPVTLCTISNTEDFYNRIQGVKTNCLVSDAWQNLSDALRKDLNVKITYARDYVDPGLTESEEEIKQHNQGLALDIDMENMEKNNPTLESNAIYDWLAANADRLGFKKGSDAWHWTPKDS